MIETPRKLQGQKCFYVSEVQLYPPRSELQPVSVLCEVLNITLKQIVQKRLKPLESPQEYQEVRMQLTKPGFGPRTGKCALRFLERELRL